jgi:hypothetical protein
MTHSQPAIPSLIFIYLRAFEYELKYRAKICLNVTKIPLRCLQYVIYEYYKLGMAEI